MTRPEFEAYENRVEAVLASVEQTLDASERAEFDEVAAAAREVVDIRREYLELTERQIDREGRQQARGSRDDRFEDPSTWWDAAVARFGLQAVETANEVLLEFSHYREGLERIDAGELRQSFRASYQVGLEREINRAAEMAVDRNNQYMREVAKSDQDLQRMIDQIELSRAEDKRIDAGTNDRNESALGEFQEAESEQHLGPSRIGQSTAEQDDQISEQQATMSSEQHTKHREERTSERSSALDAKLAKSDPPQQHVPRLRQIDQELEERRDRDRER